MHLHDGRIQTHRLDAYLHQALLLQVREHRVEHTGLGPAVHARVDAVPWAVVTGQGPPFAAVGRHVQDGVDHLEIVQSHIAPLAWQQRGDLIELLASQLHCDSLTPDSQSCQFALTEPRACYELPARRLMALKS